MREQKKRSGVGHDIGHDTGQAERRSQPSPSPRTTGKRRSAPRNPPSRSATSSTSSSPVPHDDRLVALATGSGLVYWNADAEGNALGDQPAWRAYTGQSREEVEGRGFLTAIHPNDRAQVEAAWAQAVSTSSRYESEYSIRRADGVYRVFYVRAAPVRNEDGSVREWVGMASDITERQTLERRATRTLDALLQLAETLIAEPAVERRGASDAEAGETEGGEQDETETSSVARSLAELAQSALDCDKVSILRVEPETERLLPLAAVGLTPDQERHWRAQALRERYSLRNAQRADVVARLRAGEPVALDLSAPPYAQTAHLYGLGMLLLAPIRSDDQLTGLLTLDYAGEPRQLTHDELALAQGVARLTGLALERARLLRERSAGQARETTLLEMNRRMDEFLSVASHELRTPLTTLKLNTQVARRRLNGLHQEARLRFGDELDAPKGFPTRLAQVLDLLERAEKQVDVQNRLVGDLLDASRIQANTLEMRMSACDLRDIVREAVEEQRLAAPERVITLTQPDDAPIPLIADAERIGQVVTNYLTNALKYTPTSAPIAVTVAHTDAPPATDAAPEQAGRPLAVVRVRDEGPGVPIEEQERIWERFRRVEGAHASATGLGLGLYICKTIIARHGGAVGLESAPGQGATFWFSLPLA